ncbi:MAG TPA: hypothetical protein VLG47_03610 [Candidatus Saccharimonadales bacterium]|nr:hypothetical protein [Candidatus Saccharimonadales bacterium]
MAGIVELDPFLQSGSPIADTVVEPEVSRLLAEGGVNAFWRAALDLATRNDTGFSWVNDGESFGEDKTKRIVHARGKFPGALDPKTGHEVIWEADVLMDNLPHGDIPRYEVFTPVFSNTFDTLRAQMSVMALGNAKAPTIPGAIAIAEFTGTNTIPDHASLAHPKIHWKKHYGTLEVKDDTHEFEIVTNISDVSVNRLLSAVLRMINNK